VAIHDLKKIKIGSKTMNFIFIKYVYNNSAYQFLIYKPSINDVHLNTIMESMNAIFFGDIFP
jgi:hypothetical protein